MQSLYIATFGCQMNVYDSKRMAQFLQKIGYQDTDDIRQADLILINTCSVRKKAEQKAYSLLGRLKRLKSKRSHVIIGMGGCVAQQEGQALLNRFPHLDIVFGTSAIHKLPQYVSQISSDGGRICDILFDHNGEKESLCVNPLIPGVKSYVTIMEGCNNFCSYCIVPYVRGREKSRKSDSIIEEVRQLAESGVKEVTLLGQNVNSYGINTPGEMSFSGLLKEISKIQGLKRIRFTTSHPKDLSDELMECFGSINHLCEHIHLPLQAGSDNILEHMNRGYTLKEYVDKLKRLRQISPKVSITSDIIVGFPGEKDRDFQKTLEAMISIEFDSVFSFKYSDRPYTKASSFNDKVPEDVKNRRLSTLQKLQKDITLKKNKKSEGNIEEVLVEGRSKKNLYELTGRTRSNKVVNFPGDHDLVGKLIGVRIEKAYVNSLKGIMEGS